MVGNLFSGKRTLQQLTVFNLQYIIHESPLHHTVCHSCDIHRLYLCTLPLSSYVWELPGEQEGFDCCACVDLHIKPQQAHSYSGEK